MQRINMSGYPARVGPWQHIIHNHEGMLVLHAPCAQAKAAVLLHVGVDRLVRLGHLYTYLRSISMGGVPALCTCQAY